MKWRYFLLCFVFLSSEVFLWFISMICLPDGLSPLQVYLYNLFFYTLSTFVFKLKLMKFILLALLLVLRILLSIQHIDVLWSWFWVMVMDSLVGNLFLHCLWPIILGQCIYDTQEGEKFDSRKIFGPWKRGKRKRKRKIFGSKRRKRQDPFLSQCKLCTNWYKQPYYEVDHSET